MSAPSADAARAPRSDRFREALVFGATLCDPIYARSDAEAVRQQRRHRRIVVAVAVAGTVAILAGIVPLADRVGETAAKLVEALAAVTALLAVAFGLYARSQRRWLLERHRAERVRETQYRALIAFAGDRSRHLVEWGAALSGSIAELESLTVRDMERWLVEEAVREELAVSAVDDTAVRELVASYAAGRLHEECEYFRRRAERNQRAETTTRQLVVGLFFVSVGAVVPASLVRLVHGPESLALAFLAVAAGGPAIGAGIRLVRSAHEFSRNGARFRAKHRALSALHRRIVAGKSAAETLRDVEHAETLLAAEHREWLRLMRDAEWYG